MHIISIGIIMTNNEGFDTDTGGSTSFSRLKNSQAYLNGNLKPAFVLSLIIGLLMAGVSLAGLLFPGSLYPTEELQDAFLANDVVNLCIGLPILLGSMWWARHGRLVGLLLWPGALLYILYNYVAYAIGMPFGWISLAYLGLVLLSGSGIGYWLRSIDKESVQQRLEGFVPAKSSGWVLAGLGGLFFLRGLSLIIQAGRDQVTLPMSGLGVLAADMILSASWIAGGMLLLRRNPLGYVAGLGLLFSGSLLFISLIMYLLLAPLLTGAPFAPADVMVVLSLGMVCFIPFFLYLRGVLLHDRLA
jgi:hypothetical protein